MFTWDGPEAPTVRAFVRIVTLKLDTTGLIDRHHALENGYALFEWMRSNNDVADSDLARSLNEDNIVVLKSGPHRVAAHANRPPRSEHDQQTVFPVRVTHLVRI